MAKISVQRALTELKNVDARIKATILGVNVVKAHQKGKNIGTETPQDFVRRGAASMQSATDLMKRFVTLKQAIHMSNSTTVVKIGGQEMTVLQAIIRKESIPFEKMLLQKLETQLSEQTRIAEAKNAEVALRADELAKTQLGADYKSNSEEVAKIQQDFLGRNEWQLTQAIEVTKKIEEMTKSLNDFITEVDYTLSESNAVTLIEIED